MAANYAPPVSATFRSVRYQQLDQFDFQQWDFTLVFYSKHRPTMRRFELAARTDGRTDAALLNAPFGRRHIKRACGPGVFHFRALVTTGVESDYCTCNCTRKFYV